ncbi:MAG: aspartate kinase [bacterium]|nr:aspartate kinase [bacterium]
MRVLKFGGTSVGTPQRIRSAARIVASCAEEHRTLVVVSALAGVTDRLVRMTQQAIESDRRWIDQFNSLEQRHLDCLRHLLGGDNDSLLASELRSRLGRLRRLFDGVTLLRECSSATRDRILASGERLSSVLMVAALQADGCEASAVDGGRLIRTDSTFGEANVDIAGTHQLVASWLVTWNCDTIPIVSGFVGADENGKTTTLGRGGSDLSAAVIGAALEAERVEIWTDVDGVLSASPHLISKPQILDRLSYRTAAELAYFGAKVLHRKTMAPLERSGIPIYIRNTSDPDGGYSEVSTYTGRDPGVCAVTAVRQATAFTLSSHETADVAELFKVLTSDGIEPLLADLAPASRRLVLVVPTARANTVEQKLHRLSPTDIEISREDGHSLVALVGERIDELTRITAEAFSALIQSGIAVRAVSSGASLHGLSLLLDQSDLKRAVQILHESFVEVETDHCALRPIESSAKRHLTNPRSEAPAGPVAIVQAGR